MSTQQDQKLYSIREASQLSGLPSSTLRYYESVGIIQSVTRDESSGHRTYTQDDINIIDSIACLSATGMPLEDMRQYLSNRDKGDAGVGAEIALLKTQRRRLKDELSFLKIRRDYVELKISYWDAVKANDATQIERIINEANALSKVLKFPGSK